MLVQCITYNMSVVGLERRAENSRPESEFEPRVSRLTYERSTN